MRCSAAGPDLYGPRTTSATYPPRCTAGRIGVAGPRQGPPLRANILGSVRGVVPAFGGTRDLELEKDLVGNAYVSLWSDGRPITPGPAPMRRAQTTVVLLEPAQLHVIEAAAPSGSVTPRVHLNFFPSHNGDLW